VKIISCECRQENEKNEKRELCAFQSLRKKAGEQD
jgi:hypothetical protein